MKKSDQSFQAPQAEAKGYFENTDIEASKTANIATLANGKFMKLERESDGKAPIFAPGHLMDAQNKASENVEPVFVNDKDKPAKAGEQCNFNYDAMVGAEAGVPFLG